MELLLRQTEAQTTGVLSNIPTQHTDPDYNLFFKKKKKERRKYLLWSRSVIAYGHKYLLILIGDILILLGKVDEQGNEGHVATFIVIREFLKCHMILNSNTRRRRWTSTTNIYITTKVLRIYTYIQVYQEPCDLYEDEPHPLSDLTKQHYRFA